MKKEILLAGILFLTPSFLETQSNTGKEYKKEGNVEDVAREQRIREDERNLESIMNSFWEERGQIICQRRVNVRIFDEVRELCMRIEKPRNSLRILFGIGEKDLHERVMLDNCTVYLIYNKDSRFRIEEREVVFDPIKHNCNYTTSRLNLINSYEEEVYKETQDIVYKVVGKISSEANLRKLTRLLDFGEFMRENYERGQAIQEGNLKTKKAVYIREIPIYPAADLFGLPEKKGYDIEITSGEEVIKGIIIFYSISEAKGLIKKRSDIEHESFFIK